MLVSHDGITLCTASHATVLLSLLFAISSLNIHFQLLNLLQTFSTKKDNRFHY